MRLRLLCFQVHFIALGADDGSVQFLGEQCNFSQYSLISWRSAPCILMPHVICAEIARNGVVGRCYRRRQWKAVALHFGSFCLNAVCASSLVILSLLRLTQSSSSNISTQALLKRAAAPRRLLSWPTTDKNITLWPLPLLFNRGIEDYSAILHMIQC